MAIIWLYGCGMICRYIAIWVYGYMARAWYGCIHTIWLYGYMTIAVARSSCLWLYDYTAVMAVKAIWLRHGLAVYDYRAIRPCGYAMVWLYTTVWLYGFMAKLL